MGEPLRELLRRGHELKAAGRLADAIDAYSVAVENYPTDAYARHNLAAALGDAGRWQEAAGQLEDAFRFGLDAAETWLIQARASLNLGRYEDAERGFREVLRRDPSHLAALYELAQLIWMRTTDRQAALAHVEAALARTPGNPAPLFVKARILEFTGDVAGSFEASRALAERQPDIVEVLIAASDRAIAAGEIGLSLDYARRALERAPDDPRCLVAVAIAHMAAGQPDRAEEPVARLRRIVPENQHAIALQATAWRLMGDDRHKTLHDYDTVVRASRLATPQGWAGLGTYLDDLATELKSLHVFQSHPFGQSVRHGSQIPDILSVDRPAIQAFRQAIAAPIDAHLAALGQGKDPLRSRNRGGWRIHGIWSVLLRPGQGHHVDHVHPDGWISSACYIELPERIGRTHQEGWLKFGEPGIVTDPKLEAEHAICPEPGLLALFPSYLWHGTVKFSGDQPRLVIAFDLVPA